MYFQLRSNGVKVIACKLRVLLLELYLTFAVLDIKLCNIDSRCGCTA
jgi:hypothetical protein